MRDKALNIELMSLKFFSSRFLIRKLYLEYGIVVKTNRKTEETEIIPAILINNYLPLFIDICGDKLKSYVSDSRYGYETLPCEFLQDETDYIFRTNEHKLKLSKGYMAEFYSSKCFSPFTKRIVGAIPEDFIDTSSRRKRFQLWLNDEILKLKIWTNVFFCKKVKIPAQKAKWEIVEVQRIYRD
jgi:hypothetical protein